MLPTPTFDKEPLFYSAYLDETARRTCRVVFVCAHILLLCSHFSLMNPSFALTIN